MDDALCVLARALVMGSSAAAAAVGVSNNFIFRDEIGLHNPLIHRLHAFPTPFSSGFLHLLPYKSSHFSPVSSLPLVSSGHSIGLV
ncbi:hypothetical protein Scep_022145 [Stephania cephalantha]|uniref:Uncharacterized protein n=1 Tax=Stephania cephalantha TaxID=152367 RepID=A0AAP0I1Y3_9MAGN